MSELDIKKLDKKVIKNFGITTLALKNKTTVFLLTLVIIIFGAYSYNNMPKELFPDITFPWIMVQTIYPGNPPEDMENLITRPIEQEIDGVKGINNITSTSSQDISFIMVEFNYDVDIKTAENDIKSAVDNVKLPSDLLNDPTVMDVDVSEFPIININLWGDYSTMELKKYAEILQDKIEGVSEISKVVITGINEREIQVNVDLDKMAANLISFRDVENAISLENMSISGGEITMDGTKRSIRTLGEFTNINEISDIIVKRDGGNIVYLRDIAEVEDTYEEPTSYTRLNGKPVVSLQVVKKGGENLLSATKKIETILTDIKKSNQFPKDLKINTTNDQSEMVKTQLLNLENSMIMSIIFVIIVLFLFLGTRNSLFVGIAIPLSMLLSFIVLNMIGYRINMIVLFSLILALGMLVDNAIVVVENIYRFVSNGHTKLEAAKQSVGEIAVPIIASTATTLAAFLPLVFWDSMIGNFMKYLPITLIIVLTSSLFVALVIIPVFSATFVKLESEQKKSNRALILKIMSAFTLLAILFYVLKIFIIANILAFIVLLSVSNLFFLQKLGKWFQNVFLVKLEAVYSKSLKYVLGGKKPFIIIGFSIFLLFFTLIFYAASSPNVLFFPKNEPDYINILAELPVGTDTEKTNKFSKQFSADIDSIIKPYSNIIESNLVNVGDGAKLENSRDFGSSMNNKCLVTLSFADFQERNGISTSEIMTILNLKLKNHYPGVLLTIDKNSMGPPTGKPINIEVTGDNFDNLILISDSIMSVINASEIEGIEGLKMDMDIGLPEMIISIDRDKARRFEMSTAQIASTIRTALFGKKVSDYKVGEDEYPIQLRSGKRFRNSISSLMNQKIVFMNNKGKWMSIPISAVADIKNSSTYGSVKRKDLKRMITIYSNVVESYNPNNVVEQIKANLKGNYIIPEGYSYNFTGEQEDQAKSMSFLITAMIIAVALITLILVSQFNSITKPFIIMASVLFSTIGVFGGLATFKMDFIVVMTGIGIVALAGVVVNNAIVLIDYIELLKKRKRKELGLEENSYLPIEEATQCIIQAGRTRLRPVLLTAITTILGLIPMAIGFNIDFNGLMTDLKPNIFFGGNMTAMWAPISWTIIFGLSFATFLTLIIVPVMYRIAIIIQKVIMNSFSKGLLKNSKHTNNQ